MSDNLMLPPTANKKAKARRVFGDAAVADEVEDIVDSLEYSSSTPGSCTSNKSTTPHARSCGDEETSTFSTSSATAAARLSSATLVRQSSSTAATVRYQDTRATKHQPSRSSGPFDEIIAKTDKENTDGTPAAPIPLITGSEFQSASTQLPAPKRTPFREELMRQTQEAVNRATISVHKSLNNVTFKAPPKNISIKPTSASVNDSLAAARKARDQLLRQKSRENAMIRQELHQDNLEAKQLHDEAAQSRREFLALRRDISSKFGQEKAKRAQIDRLERLKSIDEEGEFNSAVYRDHQQKLKEEEDRKRRVSIETREKVRENNRSGIERLNLHKLKEQHQILDERHEASMAIAQAKKQNANQRRQSYVFRAGDARRIRDLHIEMEQKRQESSHKNYELKWAGERDAGTYKKKLEDNRRKSIAGRLKEAAQHARVMKELSGLASEKEAESYVLKWAGENDAKEYHAKIDEERRQSLRERGKQAQHHRRVDEEQQLQRLKQIQEDEALRAASYKDVTSYKKDCKERERACLEYERREAHILRIKERERHMKEVEVEQKSLTLEALANADVKAYVEDCKQRRRLSLAFRAREKRRHARLRRDWETKEQQSRNQLARDRLMDQRYADFARQQERYRIAINTLRHAGYSFNG